MIDPNRTAKDALKTLLASRLQFGNPDQIFSVRIVEMAESLIGVIRKCPDCNGDGELPDYGSTKECEKCEGEGWYQWTRDEAYALSAQTLQEKTGTVWENAAA